MAPQSPESPVLSELYRQAAVIAAASEIITKQAVRVWVSGTVAVEWNDSNQRQPFANWTQSRLRYHVGLGNTPPEGYTGTEYVPATYPD
jgi:hypothetical protein